MKKPFKRNKQGIEGLPLKLLIVVIITVVALGIIMVWLGQIGGPKTIKLDTTPSVIPIPSNNLDDDVNRTVTLTITARDSNNNRLKGVTVTVTSAGATLNPQVLSNETDDQGEVRFQDVDVGLLGGQATGELKVKGVKSGYQKGGEDEITIIVRRE